MRFAFIVLTLALAIIVGGCSSKKIIVKECNRVENQELFVCDKF